MAKIKLIKSLRSIKYDHSVQWSENQDYYLLALLLLSRFDN